MSLASYTQARLKSFYTSFQTQSGFLKVAQGIFVASFFIFQFSAALVALGAFTQNNNLGSFTLTFFNNPQGMVSDGAPYRENITVDTVLGKAGITPGNPEGYFTTSHIQPASFKSWNQLTIDADFSDPNEVLWSILDCDATAIPAYDSKPLTSNVFDISGISPIAHPCIQVLLFLTDGSGSGGSNPTINRVKVTWNPYPAYLITGNISTSVQAGNNIVGVINYSVSYVDDVNTVVWTELPSTVNGTVNPLSYNSGYGQNPNPTFVSASNNGVYTASSITINGITVPANSIYWTFQNNLLAGQSGTLSYQLHTEIGWQTGMQFETVAHIDSLKGLQADSDLSPSTAGIQPYITTLVSSPNPKIEKTVAGVATINNINYVVNSGTYTPVITYTVKYSNGDTATIGAETIFHPTIQDDISDILNKLSTVCSVASPATRITVLNSGSLSGTTITWDPGDIADIAPGNFDTVSYTVDYTGCPQGPTVYQNDASGFADNATQLFSSVDVQVGVDETPRGYFAKGDTVQGTTEIKALNDDNKTKVQTYGDIFSYNLYGANQGAVAIGDVLLIDHIPAGLSFVSTALPGSIQGTIYYSTNPTASAPVVVPGVGITTGGDWTSTLPAIASDVKWVTAYVSCLDSGLFPAPIGNTRCAGQPSSLILPIQVSIDTPGNICLDTEIQNTGTMKINAAASSITSDGLDTPANMTVSDNEQTHVSPSLGVLSASSTINGPVSIQIGLTGTYTFTVTNTGIDGAQNTTVTVPNPQILVNGVMTAITPSSVTGAPFTITPTQTVVDLGTIAQGASKSFTIRFNIPAGIINNSVLNISASITATDDNNCRTISAELSKATTILSRPKIQASKTVDESVVPAAGDIHYSITYKNTGTSPTTGTYVIDHVPYNAVFKEAYTTGVVNNNTYTCVGCTVYFSNDPALPSALSPTGPMDAAKINQYFTQGIESPAGVWTPNGITADQVLWIAWLVDDTSFPVDILPTGAIGKVGMTVTNDDNGVLAGTIPSQQGTFVANAAGIFSNELLQAIDNQVLTTILPDPGLRIEKTSDKEVVYAGEGFNWNIDYFNDSGNNDTTVSITDTLPLGTTLVDAFYTWNAVAVANGAPSGEFSILSNPNLLVQTNTPALGETTVTLQVANTVSGLRGGGAPLRNLEGGRIRLQISTLTTLPTFSTLTNVVVGCFDNTSGSFCVNDQDDVDIANPDLYIRKFVDVPDPLAGEDISYTVIVSNEGIHDAPDALVRDVLPAGLCYAGPTTLPFTNPAEAGWTIGEPTITGGPCATASTTLEWKVADGNELQNPAYTPLGTIPANSVDLWIRYKIHVDSGVLPGTTLTNGAHTETPLTEDCYTNTVPACPFVNDTSEDVTTPLPDPYVTKSGDFTVMPGATMTYTVSYGNTTRETAQNAYIIDTFPISNYPDYASNPTPDMKLVSVAGNHGEVIYYHDGPLSATPPPFNWATPDPSWTTIRTANSAFVAIKIPQPLVGQAASYPWRVTFNFQATDPVSNSILPAGLTLTNKAEIFSSTTDSDLSNNLATAATHTPGLDLAVTKTGSIEGGFPGAAPGDAITYTLTVSNAGTVDACGVYVTDALGTNLVAVPPIHNFNTLDLKDAFGNPILPNDLSGNPISSPVTINFSGTGGSYRWDLGSASSSSPIYYQNICMPPGSIQTFKVFAKVVDTITVDATPVVNNTVVGEDSPAVEDLLSNNTDSSSTIVYLADLTIDKSGFSCGANFVCGDSDDDPNWAKKNEYIQYHISYDNNGSIDAKNPVIVESIPAGTCFRLNSITPIPGASIEYYSASAAAWFPQASYVPSGNPDCDMTQFRVVFNTSLPAPAHFDSENSLAELSGPKTNLEGVARTLGDFLQLIQQGLPTVYGERSSPQMADYDGDTKNDLFFSGQLDGSNPKVFRNQSTPGTVSFVRQAASDFTQPSNYYGSSYVDAEATVDFGGSPLPDIVVMDGYGIQVYQNESTVGSGNITFNPIYTSPQLFNISGSGVFSPYTNYKVADLNNDSKPDLLLFGGVDSKACVNTTSPGNAPISFTCTTGGPGADGGLGITAINGSINVAADFNKDGFTDIGVGHHGVSSNAIYQNDTLTPGSVNIAFSLVFSDAGYSYFSKKGGQAIDLDGDTFLDLVFGRWMYHNNSTPGGPVSFAYGTNTGSYGPNYFEDFNGDGLPELIATGSAFATQHAVSLNTSTAGSINFVRQPLNNVTFTTWSTALAQIYDFNGDGRKDIFLPGFDYNSGIYTPHSEFFRNTSSSPSVSFVASPDAGAHVYTSSVFAPRLDPPQSFSQELVLMQSPVVADFDGDGAPDVLVGGGLTDTISSVSTAPAIFHNETAQAVRGDPLVFGTYNSAFSPLSSFQGVNMLVDDFDKDSLGLPDILFASIGQGTSVFTNKSAPNALNFVSSSQTAYFSSGTYETTIDSTGLIAWDKLQVVQVIPPGTDIKFSLYSDAGYTSIIPGYNLVSATSGYIDLSSVPSAYGTLYMRITLMTSDPQATPALDAWRATYKSYNSPSFDFGVQVTSTPTVSVIDNTVSISSDTPETRYDNNSDNYQMNVTQTDLEITKTVDKAAADTFDVLTYTLRYENVSSQTAQMFSISDPVPNVLNSVSAIASLTSGGDTVTCSVSFGTVTCFGGPLSPGEWGTVTITATVSGFALGGSTITNTTHIASPITYEPNLDNNDDSASTFIGTRANVYVTKDGPASTPIGQNITYTLSYGNNGNDDAGNVQISDILDPNVDYVSYVQTGAGPFVCAEDIATHTLNCNTTGGLPGVTPGPTLVPGATGTITITVFVHNDTNLLINNTILRNHVDISTESVEVTLSDNHDDHDVPVLPLGNSSIAGYVFLDSIPSTPIVQRTLFETGIGGVDVFLAGVDIYGNIFGPDKTLYPIAYQSMMQDLVSLSLIPSGTYLASEPYPTGSYFPLDPKTTASNGTYSFAGLSAGTYTLFESQPNGYLSTGSNAGYRSLDPIFFTPVYNPAIDGEGTSDNASIDVDKIMNIILGDGQQAQEYDFGEVNGIIGDQIFLDADGDGFFDSGETGIGNVTVAIYTDANNNGTIDAGEPFKSATTNGSGFYQVTNMPINTTYIVKVTDNNNVLGGYSVNLFPGSTGLNNEGKDPSGYRLVLTGASPSNTTADFAYGSTTTCTVNCGGTGPGTGPGTTDTGTTGCTVNCNPITGSIGNTVFLDENSDGIFNGSDVGIPGVEVLLFIDENNDGAITTESPLQIHLTSTDDPSTPQDESGLYQFVGLDVTKHYIIRIGSLPAPIDTALPSINNLPPNQNADRYGKDPSGYIVILSASNPSDQTADFGYKGGELVATGQNRLNNVIISIVMLLAALAIAGVLRRHFTATKHEQFTQ